MLLQFHISLLQISVLGSRVALHVCIHLQKQKHCERCNVCAVLLVKNLHSELINSRFEMMNEKMTTAVTQSFPSDMKNLFMNTRNKAATIMIEAKYFQYMQYIWRNSFWVASESLNWMHTIRIYVSKFNIFDKASNRIQSWYKNRFSLKYSSERDDKNDIRVTFASKGSQMYDHRRLHIPTQISFWHHRKRRWEENEEITR